MKLLYNGIESRFFTDICEAQAYMGFMLTFIDKEPRYIDIEAFVERGDLIRITAYDLTEKIKIKYELIIEEE